MDDAEHYTLGYNDYWFGLDEPALTHYHYMQGWMAAFMEHCHHEHGVHAPTNERTLWLDHASAAEWEVIMKYINDEGYYHSYCPVERRRTEHERGECLSCWNKENKRRRLDSLTRTR